VEKYKRYDFKGCCPNLIPKCDEIAPQIDFTVIKPSSTNNNDGQISVKFTGLYSRYLLSWSDGVSGPVSGSTLRTGLVPGFYSVSIQDVNNKSCVWSYTFEVPSYEEFTVELYYRDLLDKPVPRYAVPLAFQEEDTSYYWNNDKILKRGTNGQTQCFEIVISGGTGPYKSQWFDYVSYGGVVPTYLTNVLPQTATVQIVNLNGVPLEQRPPLVVDGRNINIKQDVLEVCINVAPINGNGWIKIVVTDSTVPFPRTKTLWLYLKQSPIV